MIRLRFRRTLASVARAFAAAAIAAALASPFASAQVKVSGDWISLGDVAPNAGAASGLLLAASPPPGHTLALDPKFVVGAAKAAGVTLSLPDAPILIARASALSAKPAAAPTGAAKAVPVSATPAASVLTLTRDIARGDIVGDGDVALTPSTGAAFRGSLKSPAEAIGLEARRALRAGDELSPADLHPHAVVRRGQPVTLVYQSGSLKLTVEGQAQNDAAIGEPVRVLNKYSKRSLDAFASGESEARVNRLEKAS